MNYLIINSVDYNYELSVYLNDSSYKLAQNDLSFPIKDDIVNLLNNLLNKYKLKLNNIDRIGVVIGPGGYTSLRVGIALANSLSFVLNIPIIGVSLFDVLLGSATKLINKSTDTNYAILTIIPDYKGGFFGQFFDNNFNAITAPMVIEQNIINYYKCQFVISNDIVLVKKLLCFDEKIIMFEKNIDSKNIKNVVVSRYNKDIVEINQPLDVLYIKAPKITKNKD